MSRMSAVAGYCCKSIFTPARGIIVRNPTAGDFPCFLPTPANPDATLTAVDKAAGVSRQRQRRPRRRGTQAGAQAE